MLGKVDEDVVRRTIGNNHLDTLVGYLTGDLQFRDHSSASEVALGVLNILTEITVVVDHRDDARVRSLGVPVVDAINIGKDDERLGVHHRSHKTGELIVVREHQLRDAHRVVLIDDRHDPTLQHHRDTGTLVEILATGGKALLHRQHLTDMHAILTKKIIIKADKLHLTNRREKLALLHTVQFASRTQFAFSTSQ